MNHAQQRNQQDRATPVTSSPAGSGAEPVHEDQAHRTQASGPVGDNPSTAGPGPTGVTSKTPENDRGHLNPSAPEDANTTPGSTNDK